MFNQKAKTNHSLLISYLLVSCLLSTQALAHGDEEHDVPAKKVKPAVVKPFVKPIAKPVLPAAPANQTPPTTNPKVLAPATSNTIALPKPANHEGTATATTTALILNGKATLSPSSMRYAYSPIDGLLTIKNRINIGDPIKKGQLLGTVVNTLQPIDKINQAQQIQTLQGQARLEAQNLKRLNLVPDLVTKKEIEAAQTNLQNLQQQIQVAKKPLQQSYSIYSPASGFVVASSLDANKQVDSKQVLLSLATTQVANEVHANYFMNANSNIKANSQIKAHLTTMPNITLKYLGYLAQSSVNSANNGVLLRFAIPSHLVNDAGLFINSAVQISVEVSQ